MEWREDKFERGLNALKQWVKEHGEIPKVDGSDVVMNGETFKLGTWVSCSDSIPERVAFGRPHSCSRGGPRMGVGP